MDDFHDLVIAWGRHPDLAALGADGSVDGVYLCLLAPLDVLEHACLEKGVLLYSERNDEEGDGFLERIAVVEQFHDVLALYRLNLDSRCVTDIDALLDEPLDNAA